MVVTDYDGTLLGPHGEFPDENRRALEQTKEEGYLRVIATGRSLYSLWRSASKDLPVDYIVFSSGAGILEMATRTIVRTVLLESTQVSAAVSFLTHHGMDFMVHDPIPENHRFTYHESGRHNPDFRRRCEIYAEFCTPLDRSAILFGPSTQLLVVDPPGSDAVSHQVVRRGLPGFTVLRSTSPLDGVSTWIEIFPENVSKSHTSAWLAGVFGLESRDTLAIGNDYNDSDLLDWARTAYVVANAPGDLRRLHPSVPSNAEAGVAVAIRRWLSNR